jgi:sterol desaturase/sphingolipid hydroxylase (fatty acid hydroxylase superfamily)
VLFFMVYMTLNALIPGLMPAALAAHALLPVGALPVVLQVLIGYAVLSLMNALLHRSYHRFNFLWRWVHQLHHAPQRLDAAGAIVMTPFEMAGYIVVFQLVIVFALGLNALAAALVGYVSTFYTLFQHMNVRTPQWLGIFIQRPESHGVHHRRGLHGYNYSDLPIWDMVMGTFRNPRLFNGDVGFGGPSEPRIWRTLRGVDVNAQAYGAGNRGTQSPDRNPA